MHGTMLRKRNGIKNGVFFFISFFWDQFLMFDGDEHLFGGMAQELIIGNTHLCH